MLAQDVGQPEALEAVRAAVAVERQGALDRDPQVAAQRQEIADRAEVDVRRLVPLLGQGVGHRHAPEDEQRQAEIDAETFRLAAVDSGALAVYMAQIRQKIERNWAAPASASVELECSVRVRQIPGGEVIGVTILSCNGDEAVRRSVEAAVHKSSPLPEPSDPSLFDRNILLKLNIRQ